MSLLEGQVFMQIALVFALIGVLGLILKWTFSRDRGAPRWPAESPTHAPLPTWPAAGTETWRNATVDPRGPEPAAAPMAQSDDYGLLASVAAVDTGEEAARVRSLLAGAGIRATTTVGVDGRHRVLVFASELHRARRVAGGA